MTLRPRIALGRSFDDHMGMMRQGVFLAISVVLLLSGCQSVDTSRSSLHARLAAARADAETHAAADDFSQFLIARYASLINDPDEAAEKYALVARSRPQDASIMERAVFSALLANEYPLALSISQKAGEQALRDSSLPRLTLAADALASGQTRDVAGLIQGSDPGMFNAMIMDALAAWSLFAEGRTDEARTALLNASGGEPYLDSLALNLVAIMDIAAGNDETALATFSAIEASGTLIAIGADSYARLLSSRGDNARALSVLRQFRDAAGHNPVVSDLIAKLDAGKTLTPHRLDASQGAALSVYVPAAALAEQSQTDLPGVYYSLALRLDPDLHAARALWADALDVAGRRDESIRMLETIPASSPYFTTARGQLAWALRRDEQNDAALKLAYSALASTPDRDLKIQMGDLLRSLGRSGEAEKVFTEIIEADKLAGVGDWRLYYARGAVRERMGSWPLAEEDLQTARTLNPASPDVLNYLGYSWVDRGVNLQAGLDLIRKALTLRPESGAITDSLGWAHYQTGNYEAAIGYLERAVELEPGVAEINDHLGDAYWMTGRQTEARYQWQRAISLSAEGEDVERLERKLLTGPAAAAAHAQLP